jgi:hypothetical protein
MIWGAGWQPTWISEQEPGGFPHILIIDINRGTLGHVVAYNVASFRREIGDWGGEHVAEIWV